MPIGPWELLILLFVVLLLFGAKKVPEMGRDLGRGMREFKEGITNPFGDDDERPRQLERAQSSTQATTDSRERVST